ncbi:MAG TPA: Flp pilus assembly protein CpaB [Solirubrobacteraceae bacterium]|jgi:Flp pilus assembly protein CpaB|nr:Flp pilus assembly protein CpaB [Solirubrobacteraceae bacterium]
MEVTQRRPVGSKSGGWSSTRRGTLAIAALSTLVAAAILVFALQRYRQSVESSSKPATVLVAKRLIQKGTSGAAVGVGQYFRTARIPDKQVATGALANTAALHGEVAARDIYPGQQLTAADFVSGGLFYSRLPRNLRAVSVPVDTSHGMIGNVQTGDRVDVYVSFKKEEQKPAFLRLVAPYVVVLDAGRAPTGGGLGGSLATQTANVVLEVNIHQAAELAFSADFGKVWLVLSPAHGTSPSKEVIDELSILAGNPGVSQEGTK